MLIVSEILKDEKGQRHAIVIRHLGYSKKSMTSQQGKILFLKKQLANIFNVQIHLDLYAYTCYVNCEVFRKISLRLTQY